MLLLHLVSQRGWGSPKKIAYLDTCFVCGVSRALSCLWRGNKYSPCARLARAIKSTIRLEFGVFQMSHPRKGMLLSLGNTILCTSGARASQHSCLTASGRRNCGAGAPLWASAAGVPLRARKESRAVGSSTSLSAPHAPLQHFSWINESQKTTESTMQEPRAYTHNQIRQEVHKLRRRPIRSA